jgi:hypothetical protein
MDMGKISKPTLNRLRKELQAIQKEPPPNIAVSCDEADILNFHYIITGPPGTLYAGGEVHPTRMAHEFAAVSASDTSDYFCSITDESGSPPNTRSNHQQSSCTPQTGDSRRTNAFACQCPTTTRRRGTRCGPSARFAARNRISFVHHTTHATRAAYSACETHHMPTQDMRRRRAHTNARDA